MLTPAEKQRLLRALEQDHEFRQAVRNILLGEELLALPEKFAEFTTYVHQRFKEQQKFNDKVDAFMDKVNTFMARQDAFNKRTDDTLGILKGNAARRLLQDHYDSVLNLVGLDFAKYLSRQDLIAMLRNYDKADTLPFGDRRSFMSADLVLQGTNQAGETQYIAAEASFTADQRDSDRAMRNARFITEFTGCVTHSVIGSVNNDHHVQQLVDTKQVLWFQLEERELQPD